MKDDTFSNAIHILAGAEAPRVWSLIITVFGDLAQHQGNAISGPVLGKILSPMGIRPEAMRVALHRLRNEGWIETKKRGREALHVLSADGISQSAIASRRIYADAHVADERWHILCYPPALSNDAASRTLRLEKDGYVAIAPCVYLGNGIAQGRAPGAFLMHGTIDDVPEWLSSSIAPSTLIAGFTDLSAALHLLDLSAQGIKGLSPVQIATLRALIVHRWRKLVLKLPNVPDALFGADFAGSACRANVMQALAALPRPEISTLAGSDAL